MTQTATKAKYQRHDRFHNSLGDVYTVKHIQPTVDGSFTYLLERPSGEIRVSEENLLKQFSLLPTRKSKSTPYYYTGLCGNDHFEVAATGKDFIAVCIYGEWLVMPDPEDHKRVDMVLEQIQWNSWVRIRAKDMEQAHLRANDCEDQHEAFQNEYESWKEIVLTPIEEREF